jgi:hypothetical protein
MIEAYSNEIWKIKPKVSVRDKVKTSGIIHFKVINGATNKVYSSQYKYYGKEDTNT